MHAITDAAEVGVTSICAITDAAEVGVASIYVTNPLKFSPLFDEYCKSYPCVCEAHRHCSINITHIQYGETALHCAACNGYTSLCALLLDRGANVNAATKVTQ